MTIFVEKLREAMEANGFYIRGEINPNTNKFQRFRSNSGKGGKDLFVVIQGENSGATFGDWHDPDGWVTWWLKSANILSLEDRRERQEVQLAQHRKAMLERQKKVFRAKQMLEKHGVIPTENHPYLIKKKIIPYYGWQIRSYLIIPICDIDGDIISLQYIKPNGFKQFARGCSAREGMAVLSKRLPPDYKGVIRLCEGYSTGCSIMEAVGSPVICAMSASNLPTVAVLLRKTYPLASLKICADNDQWGKENTGLHYAEIATDLTGAMVYVPEFGDWAFTARDRPTDFNDLMNLLGMAEAKRQLTISRIKKPA